MKRILKPQNLPRITLAAGGIGLLLRLWLLSLANSSGFLPVRHISEILLWLLTAAVIGFLLYATRNLTQAAKYRFNFPASLPGGIGAWLGALGIGGSSLVELLSGSDTLTVITGALGLISAAVLIFVGNCRRRGKHPSSVFHAAICVYMLVRLICQYRHWSSDPQLQDYCFQILAIVCLMMAAYHRATFCANFGKRRPYAFFNLAAVYFCCLALPGWENTAFFLGCGIWMFTDICSLIPMPGRRNTDAAS